MSKPRVTTKCVANTYAAPNERIIEISSGNRRGTGNGCLVSIRDMDDGTLLIQVYRADGGVEVTGPDR